jgi:hypothetical protein
MGCVDISAIAAAILMDDCGSTSKLLSSAAATKRQPSQETKSKGREMGILQGLTSNNRKLYAACSMRNVARTVAIAGLTTLVLACATDYPASARGGGGGGGGGHGGSSPASSQGSSSPASGQGGSMMGASGFAGGTNTMSSTTLGCINNKNSSRCAGTKQKPTK